MSKEKRVTKEELIEKAKLPAKNALKMHPFFRGKIATVPRCSIRDFQDFGIWYSPGVAAPCREIANNEDLVYKYTHKWNTVAVVSDGTRVLGLGDIGPQAAMPVMEGKSLLFKYLGGVDAWPLCIGPGLDAEQIIQIVKWIQPTFGGINLEDIEKPKCFTVLDKLRADPEVKIPVWHDDQQGTACVTLAGLINALKIVGKKKSEVKIALVGAGSANVAIARILFSAGYNPKKCVFVDSQGILSLDRNDLEGYKEEIAHNTNGEGLTGGIAEAMKGADVMCGLSKPGPDTIKKEWVTLMADDAIVFACANPIPEIWPWDAKEAGARIVATGRSDFENQVNNSLGFPGIFRGTLDVRAVTITDEMCVAAAEEIAKVQEDKGLSETQIIPTMDDWEIYPREAVAVGMKAIEQGLARLKLSRAEIFEQAEKIIKSSRDIAQFLMKEGFIPHYED
ncbi:MAG: NADP-dependent malic enzyme [Candidatus Lokiarchaeota archaeon]|nr:NADP-dependent malic enzyme [Candidatus Lokiarchaeota archaeon]